MPLGLQRGERIGDAGKIPGLCGGDCLDHCHVRAARRRVAFLSAGKLKTNAMAPARVTKGSPPIQLPASRTRRRSVRTCQCQGLFQRRRSSRPSKVIGSTCPTPRPSPSTGTSSPRHRRRFRYRSTPQPAPAAGRQWLHRCSSHGIGSVSCMLSLAHLPRSPGLALPVRSHRAK